MTNPPDSYISRNSTGEATTFAGPDAVALYRAALLRGFIELHAKTGIIPTRGVTITKMLAQATTITQRHYTTRQHAQAVADLTTWINAMKCGIPVVESQS